MCEGRHNSGLRIYIKRTDYGQDTRTFDPRLKDLGTINDLLVDYSLQEKSDRGLVRLVPNTGTHNIIELDIMKGEITFKYTSPEGREQIRKLREELKDKLGQI